MFLDWIPRRCFTVRRVWFYTCFQFNRYTVNLTCFRSTPCSYILHLCINREFPDRNISENMKILKSCHWCTIVYEIYVTLDYCIGWNIMVTVDSGIFISVTASYSKCLTTELELLSIFKLSEPVTVEICEIARGKRVSFHIITTSSLTSTFLLPITPYWTCEVDEDQLQKQQIVYWLMHLNGLNWTPTLLYPNESHTDCNKVIVQITYNAYILYCSLRW